MIDLSKCTWGYEIEWGDIDRRIKIPENLGSWEYAETDIVNLKEPFKYVACDPLGTNPHFGGEINTKPTKTWQEQVNNIMYLYEYFNKQNNQPTSSCVNHGHLHVHIPGLTENLDALKKLISYIKNNQSTIIDVCYQYYDYPNIKKHKNAKMYLKYDGGRPMPEYMCNNIINLAKDFKSFIKLHCAGKDGVSMGRPFRYAINTYCLKHTQTIEFRCFRSTTNKKEIQDQFRFVEKFLECVFITNEPIFEVFKKENFNFPKFYFNDYEYNGWIKTKHPKERGEKKRTFYEVS